MKAQLGRPTGLALALLATLLATLLAMGAFSVAQAQTDPSATRTLSATSVLPGGEVMVTINVVGNHDSGVITETWPEEFSFVSVSTNIYSVDSIVRGNRIVVSNGTGQVPASFTYTLEAPQEPGGPYSFVGNFAGQVGGVEFSDDIQDGQMVTVAAAPTNGGNGDGNGDAGEVNEATDKTEPGSNQSLKVQGDVVYGPTDNIFVNLKDFGVPSSIDPSHVLVTRGMDSASPSDVEVDGTKVTLVAPFDPETAGTGNLSAREGVTTIIDFRRAAGITLPIRHGEYDVKVSTTSTTEEAGDGIENRVNVVRQVKVSPTSGTRGTEVTITGKGFLDGTAKVSIGANYSINANIDDGAFTTTVDTAVKDNDGNSVFDGSVSETAGDEDADRKTTIVVSDSDEKSAETSFEIKPSFTFDPESPTPGEDVTISLVDISGAPTSVTFTGAPKIMNVAATGDDPAVVNIRDSDGDDSTTTGWKVQVPGGTRIGTVRVTIVHPGAADPLTKTITIGTKSLELSPSTAVPGQEITIQGSGFKGQAIIDRANVTIDTKPSDDASFNPPDVDSNGNVSITMRVPNQVKDGSRQVKVTDSQNRIGVATLTVPKAAITVEPSSSLRGSTVTVSGTGFPANDLIQIKYDDKPVGTALTGPTGDFTGTIAVPSFAGIGSTNDVEADPQLNTDAGSVTAKHSTPKPAVTLSPAIAESGSLITVSGANFAGFISVRSIQIDRANVTPVPAPNTDSQGAFTTSNVRVPQLDPGRYTVKVEADQMVTAFLEVVVAVAPSAPADLFADLIEADALDRIFRYDNNETQEWFLYDPDPGFEAANSLESLEAGKIIWIQLKEAAEVQGANLLAGWSLITVQ